jgi:hypothetical protein
MLNCFVIDKRENSHKIKLFCHRNERMAAERAYMEPMCEHTLATPILLNVIGFQSETHK